MLSRRHAVKIARTEISDSNRNETESCFQIPSELRRRKFRLLGGLGLLYPPRSKSRGACAQTSQYVTDHQPMTYLLNPCLPNMRTLLPLLPLSDILIYEYYIICSFQRNRFLLYGKINFHFLW